MLVDISDTAMVVVVIVVVGTGPNIINKIPSRFIANIKIFPNPCPTNKPRLLIHNCTCTCTGRHF